jgi:hypothetical protein
MRPASFPIWDEPIRAHVARAGVGSYREFIDHVGREILDLIADASGFGIAEQSIAASVDRSGVPLVKLVDEYYWMRVTRGHKPPDREALRRWISWSA